jgi:hypothetical protein
MPYVEILIWWFILSWNQVRQGASRTAPTKCSVSDKNAVKVKGWNIYQANKSAASVWYLARVTISLL